MNIHLIIGNPKANSRTLTASKQLADTIVQWLQTFEIPVTVKELDLAVISGEIFDWSSETVKALVEEVVASDLLIVATPTYKATYTGLLKAFLDLMPHNGLAGKIAIPVMIGAAPNHNMAVETYLRPLLIELGAICPTKGLYIMESNFENLQPLMDDWISKSKKGLHLLFES